MLRWVVIGLMAAVAVAVGMVGYLILSATQNTVNQVSFESALPIPPLLEPSVEKDGRKVFDITLEKGLTDLLPGVSTETWGVNGSYLGPTLRARRGDEVLVRVSNDLPEATTIHWHGMSLPAAMDGGPHQLIEPGQTWEPHWNVDQPAAGLWYHSHPHHQTADHVYRGIAGMFIIDDDDSAELTIPSEYGVDDIPVIIQDKRFNRNGQLSSDENMGNLVGILGDEIFVNGAPTPHFEATTTLVRLRVLNASNARVYNVGFHDDRPFSLIGSDSGLLERPVERSRLQVSPGERAEIVAQIDPSERVTLRSYPPKLGMNALLSRFNGGDDTLDLMEIRGDRNLRESELLPERLSNIVKLTAEDADRARAFKLSGFSRINDKQMDLDRIDARVRAGSTELWTLTNDSNTYHNFHVHLVHFQILDIDGRAPPAELSGWKDTLFLPPDGTARVIARFDTEPDSHTPFMFHCHILEHEDAGMMGQFTVESQ